jgi:hypothetical protein
MDAPTRCQFTEPLSSTPENSASVGVNEIIDRIAVQLRGVIRVLHEVAKEYASEAMMARERGNLIESEILQYMAGRLATVSRLSEVVIVLNELIDLSKWIPPLEQFRNANFTETKGLKVHFIRSLELDQVNEGALIAKATRSPGRPAEGRAVAVPAMEMHAKGTSWQEIEKRLIPHRQGVKNPGQSIRREVQLLKATLKRYQVTLPINDCD